MYEKLNMIYVEIPKFKKQKTELSNHLEWWLYVFQNLNKMIMIIHFSFFNHINLLYFKKVFFPFYFKLYKFFITKFQFINFIIKIELKIKLYINSFIMLKFL